METAKAVANFPVSGEPIPPPVARWLGRIKGAAAQANADLGLLDRDKADRIAAAAARIANGELDDQFPIDVFQTGSGTSSNMNANEVLATLAGDDVHANDDVNMGQSSNDVFPSAVHLAALDEITSDLLPALDLLATSLEAKAKEFDDVVKSGRTHWMDAVPITLGQEFGGYGAQVREGIARVQDALPRLGKIPLGGTAVGTGLNTHPEFAERVRKLLSQETGLTISAPANPFEGTAARDGIVEASGALKTVAVSLTKIANDIRFLGSGPRAGLAEISLPELQKGSSIMPGKVNPVIPEVVTQVAAQVIGNDTAITVGGMQGHFELNVFVPLLARNILDSVKLLSSASRLFAEKCIDGIEANRETAARYAELTLSAATALNPYIGYDRASEIVKEAAATGRSLRDVAREKGVDEEILDKALDYRAMAKPHRPCAVRRRERAAGSAELHDPLQQKPITDQGSTDPGSIQKWWIETALDVEYAHAMAPGANIVLAVANTDDTTNVAQVETEVLPQYPGSIVTQSFGVDEAGLFSDPDTAAALDKLYLSHVLGGGTVVASSGDLGASGVGPFVGGPPVPMAGYPASSPFVLSVGGTMGAPYPQGLWNSGEYGGEQAWSEPVPFFPGAGAGGGAPSVVYKAPLWQHGMTGSSMRAEPDVSYNAAFNGGVVVVFAGRHGVVGGTSAGAPQWAAIVALANEVRGKRGLPPLGLATPQLWQLARERSSYRKDFHDITVGSNALGGPGSGLPGFNAGPGYDFATGLGTPQVSRLLKDLSERDGRRFRSDDLGDGQHGNGSGNGNDNGNKHVHFGAGD